MNINMAELKYMTEYHAAFHPKVYLNMYHKNYKEDQEQKFFFRAIHKFWSKVESGVRCLEYGGGPSIADLVSACPKVDCIVFAEYTEANREAVKSWISGSAEAHDWSPLMEYVVRDVEGDSALEAVSNREHDLKNKIKSIVPCDVTKNPFIDLESVDVGKPFDVVSTSLCLEACVLSEQQYKRVVGELCKLLKPGGYLFMYGVLEQTFYVVGEHKFYTFSLTKKMIEDAIKELGMQDIDIETIEGSYEYELGLSDYRALFAVSARKSLK